MFFWLDQTVRWVGFTLLITILVLLGRQKLYKQFPLFTLYVGYITLTTFLCALTVARPQLYFYVYWAAEPGAFLLKLLAVCESFMKVFRGFYLLQRFRLLLPGAITLALALSVVRAINHPTEGTMTASIIVAGTMTAQYIVLAVSILFVGLVILLHLPWRAREYRIVLGFGITALGTFSEAALRSQLGSESGLTRMLASGAYTLALVVWVTALLHPCTPRIQVDEGVSSEGLVQELRRQVAYARAMLGR